MSLKNVPIPAAAEAAGYTNLTFCEDFNDYSGIDMSGEGKPGYNFYIDRPYGKHTLTEEELEIEDSVLTLKPFKDGCLADLPTYSKKGDTGFTMQYGYAEARIRMDWPDENYSGGWPCFWSIGKPDMMSKGWTDCGEIDVLEAVPIHAKKHPIYTGTLHHHKRNYDENGKLVTPNSIASNMVNATGYNDYFDYIDKEWHTYAVLWEPGHVAWYMDNKLMHAVRYNEWDLPQCFYRDSPTPLPRIEQRVPELADRVWKGAYHIFEDDEQVFFLGARRDWPLYCDWVRIWQK